MINLDNQYKEINEGIVSGIMGGIQKQVQNVQNVIQTGKNIAQTGKNIKSMLTPDKTKLMNKVNAMINSGMYKAVNKNNLPNFQQALEKFLLIFGSNRTVALKNLGLQESVLKEQTIQPVNQQPVNQQPANQEKSRLAIINKAYSDLMRNPELSDQILDKLLSAYDPNVNDFNLTKLKQQQIQQQNGQQNGQQNTEIDKKILDLYKNNPLVKNQIDKIMQKVNFKK